MMLLYKGNFLGGWVKRVLFVIVWMGCFLGSGVTWVDAEPQPASQEERTPYLLGDDEGFSHPELSSPAPHLPIQESTEAAPERPQSSPGQSSPEPAPASEAIPPRTEISPAQAGPTGVISTETEFELKMTVGLHALSKQKYVEAAAAFKAAALLRPEDSNVAYQLGVSAAQTGDYETAEKYLHQTYRANPNRPGIALDLGIIYFRQKNYPMALLFLSQAEQRDPRSPVPYFYQGRVYQETKNDDWAVTRFRRAAGKARAKKMAWVAPSHYQAGVSLYRQGIFDEARNEFIHVLQRDPKSDLGKSAQIYVQKINQMGSLGPKVEHSLTVGYQYDSNVVLDPSDAAFSGAISGKEDGRLVLHLSGDYAFSRPSPWGMGLAYFVYSSFHQVLDPFDLLVYDARLYFLHREGEKQFRIDFSGDNVYVDHDPYLRSYTLRSTWRRSPVPERTRETFYQIQSFKFENSVESPSNSDRDGLGHTLGLVGTHIFGQRKGSAKYTYALEIRNSNTHDQDFQGHQFKAGATYQYPWSVKGELEGELLLKWYAHPSSVSNSKRQDQRYTLSVGLSRPLHEKLEVFSRLSYRDNRSSIPLFGYEKTVVSLGLTGRF